tara:strand:- start:63893 stop:65710 length:1818 start_codon:yes stop_codon:yes gene_type:complete
MTPIQRYFRAFIPLILTLCPALFAQDVRPISDRIDAIVAHPLVLPLQIDDPKSIKSGIKVRIDDGRHVESTVVYVWSTAPKQSTGWTRTTPIWNTSTPSQFSKFKSEIPGTWIALIDLPIDAVGQGIWIDEVRYEPNWLPSPARVILESSSRAHDGFWDPALSTNQRESTFVLHALTNLSADPFNRWRARLMTDGFSPDLNSSSTPANTDRDLIAIHTELLQTDSSQVLTQIADHFAARWQIILGRIWLIDPAVARRLKHQLTQTAIADEQIIPMWTDDTIELSALAHDLLSPFVNDELRVERVVAWLDSQPTSMSWIIDDAGHADRDTDGTGIHLSPEIGMLWLSNHESQTSSTLAQIQSPSIDPYVQTLQPGRITAATLAVPSQPTYSKAKLAQPRELSVRIGRRTTTLQTMNDVPLASPPGVLVGPLLSDWTLHAFGSGQSALGALPAPNERVAGLLHRATDLNNPDPRNGWRLYLECGFNPSTTNDTIITVWVGPMGFTRASWSISRNLGLLEMRTDPDIPADLELTSTLKDDRWILQLDLPAQAISPEGLLLIGIERTDSTKQLQDAQHSSWPRRMLPWQSEPGRFVVDVLGWNGSQETP